MTEDTGTEGIGVRLKRLRLARGITQRALAAPGVSYAYISRIEGGARTPSVKALRVLANKLGVTVDYLETGRDLPEAEERELRLADAELKLRLDDDAEAAALEAEEILALARAAGDRACTSRALLALGLASSRAGRTLEAVERLEAALAEQPVSPLLRPDVYITLAQSYVGLGAPDRAASLLEKCFEEAKARAPNDVRAHVRFATFLSYALTDAGDYERASAVVEDALERSEHDVDEYTRVRLYWSMSRLAGIEGDMTEALENIRRAIALLEATEDTLMLGRAYLLAANIQLERKQPELGFQYVELARRLLGPTREPLDEGMILILESRLGPDSKRSVELARDAIDILGDFHPAERGAAVWALAAAHARVGDLEAALDAYGAAVDLLAIHRRRSDAASACREWAELLRAAGRVEHAESVATRAESLSAGRAGRTPSRRSDTVTSAGP